MKSGRLRTWLPGLLLIPATFLAYLPALTGKTVWDDESWTTGIPLLLRNFSGLWTMWTRLSALQQYYPLTGTMFWLDYQLWGFWTPPYHMENVLWHSLAALLFWKLLQKLEVPGAWLAAAIFALHPVMVESAAWITERKNVLSLVFFLGALLAYLRYAPGLTKAQPSADNGQMTAKADIFPNPELAPCRPHHQWLFYGLALFLFLCALLAKTTAFSLPAVILLLCWWKRGGIRWQADVLPTLPFFALAIGLCILTAWLEKNHVGAKGPGFALSFPQRCLVAGRAPWFYTGKLLWPANLCFVYPRWRLDPASWGQWLYPGATVGTLLGLWLARKRIGRGPITAAFFFIGTLFPVLGFMNAYGMLFSFVWDHWVYLSSLGLIALMAALIARMAEYLRSPAMLSGSAVIVLPVLAILTWRQCGMYSDIDTFWQTTLARNPNCWMAHNNLGNELVQRGQFDEGIVHFEKALAINPRYAESENNFGVALMRKGLLDDALPHLQKALELNPRYAEAEYNLGSVLLQQGHVDEAIARFKTSLEFQPGYAEVHNDLGRLLFQKGQMDEAVAQYQQAIALKSDFAGAHYNLAVVFGLRGRLDDAVVQYRQTIQIDPDHADAHGNLANVLAAQGHLDEAILEYQRTLELKPASAQAHFRYGQALQTRRSYAAAISEYQKTLELNPKHLPAHLSLAWLLATCPDAALRNGGRAVALSQRSEQLTTIESPQLLDTLAAAYAEAGQFDEAVATARHALSLNAIQNNQPLAEAIRSRLQLYEAHSSYHEKP